MKFEEMINQVIEGDCLDVMKDIPDKSIDMILCDLPYGTTACPWDTVIPFEPLWEQYKRIVKDNAAIVLFGSQPFTTDLINSNREWFRYEWIWNKIVPVGFLNSYKMPMKVHENICVFYKKLPTYNPVYIKRRKEDIRRIGDNKKHNFYGKLKIHKGIYNGGKAIKRIINEEKYRKEEKLPTTILNINNGNGWEKKYKIHPTEKPVDLCQYLVQTYTNKDALVLDNCAGSGTTGRACKDLGRRFILIEKEPDYVKLCKTRLQQEVLF